MPPVTVKSEAVRPLTDSEKSISTVNAAFTSVADVLEMVACGRTVSTTRVSDVLVAVLPLLAASSAPTFFTSTVTLPSATAVITNV